MDSNTALVLLARFDPMVQLQRLRMSGRLVELRAKDLRLTRDEALQLAAIIFDPGVTESAAEILWSRTEGWIAGFRLAGLVVESADDPDAALADFSGGDKLVAEFILSEVVAELEPGVKEFLLQTSVLTELTGELCDVVTGR